MGAQGLATGPPLQSSAMGLDTAPPETVFEVEDIAGHKVKDGKDFFLIKWKGFKEASWEPDENVGQELKHLKEEAKKVKSKKGKEGKKDKKEKVKEKDDKDKDKEKDKGDRKDVKKGKSRDKKEGGREG